MCDALYDVCVPYRFRGAKWLPTHFAAVGAWREGGYENLELADQRYQRKTVGFVSADKKNIQNIINRDFFSGFSRKCPNEIDNIFYLSYYNINANSFYFSGQIVEK